jgi:anti-anti-sigma regulatory factor
MIELIESKGGTIQNNNSDVYLEKCENYTVKNCKNVVVLNCKNIKVMDCASVKQIGSSNVEIHNTQIRE